MWHGIICCCYLCPFAQWLEEEFLPYLDAWEKSVKEREGLSDAQKKRMTLSQETLLGLRITGQYGSWWHIVLCMLNKWAVGCFQACLRVLCIISILLSRLILCFPIFLQWNLSWSLFGSSSLSLVWNSSLADEFVKTPLRIFFGCQRQRGRTHDNPNVQEFPKNTQALRVVNGFCWDVAKGNCRGNKATGVTELDMKENTPLPKRKQHREKKTSTWDVLLLLIYVRTCITLCFSK